MELQSIIKLVLDNSFITALLGALIGGWFTRNATYRAHALEKSTAQLESLKVARNSIALITVELKSAWNIYNNEYAKDLMELPEGEAYVTVWAIGQNPFIIYDSMPQCLTELSPELSELVVQMYMRMKGVVAMVEDNNKYAEAAKQAGVQKLDAVMANSNSAGAEMTVEQANQHGEFLEAWVQWQAVKTGMGVHADAMKHFTTELGESMAKVLCGLSKELKSMDGKITSYERKIN